MQIDFQKYKNSLKNYLSLKGFDVSQNPVFCINPEHSNTDSPAMQLHDDGFNCFGCGTKGDIYDAAGLICGISDKVAQFKEVEQTLGYAPSTGAVKKQSINPAIIKEARQKVEELFRTHKARRESSLAFLVTRYGKGNPIIEQMVNRFGWWPGWNEAIKIILPDMLEAAGITQKAWYHSGVVLRLAQGYKLMYYSGGKCQKRNSLKAHVFAFPKVSELPEHITLVEGELDALSMLSAGFENVYSIGGTNGLSKADIVLLNKCSSVTLCMDGDEAGRKANEKISKGLKNTEVKIVLLSDGHDPDEYVKSGDIEALRAAIDSAIPLQVESPQEEQEEALKAYLDLISTPTHKKFADLLIETLLEKRWLTIKASQSHFLWYRKKGDNCYHEEIVNRLDSVSFHAKKLLFDARNFCESQNEELPQGFYSAFAKAVQKVETRDFVSSICQFLAEKLHEPDFKPDSTPWVIPCNDGFIIDFSTDIPFARKPEPESISCDSLTSLLKKY